jgi:hypothetical protein
MTFRQIAVCLSVVLAASVRVALAQSLPTVELGVDATASLDPDRGFQWGPRVVINSDERNSVQFTASLQNLRWRNVGSQDDGVQQQIDTYLVAYRRLVHASGPVRVSALLGGGLERTLLVTPTITFGDPPITFPGSRGAEIDPAFTIGATFDIRLWKRAAVAVEASAVFTDVINGRVSGGVVIPVGAYGSSRERLPSSVPWAQLDPGERAWITTSDGREVDGRVLTRTGSTLTLQTVVDRITLAAADVRAIDTTDPIRNGAVLGAKIGGLGAAGFAAFVTVALCAMEEGCGRSELLLFNTAFAGLGAGIGAVTGALADSLRERRAPLYRRGESSSCVIVAPMVGKRGFGGRAVIVW